MVRNCILSIICTFALSVLHCQQDPITFEVYFPISKEDIEGIVKNVPSSLHISSIVIESDVSISEEELKYLFNIKGGSVITSQDIQSGFWLLEKKHRFEKSFIKLEPTATGYSMHIELTGNWTFNKLKIGGFLLNKDRLGSYYLIEQGQIFDLQKHQKSIENIKKILQEDGYFAADIRENLDFNEREKLVTTHIWINRGSQFRIADVVVEIKNILDFSKEEQAELPRKIAHHLHNALLRTTYNKMHVDGEIKSLKAYLRKKGYLRSGLRVIEQVDRQNRTITLLFSFALEKKKKFIFLGNQYFSNQQLLEKVSLFGKAAPAIPSSIIAAELEDVYKKCGFLNVRVQAEEEEHRFIFLINEGRRAYINRFRVSGNNYFSHQVIQDALSEFSKNYIDHETINRIEEKIISFYYQYGFWDVSCFVSSIDKRDSGACDINLHITEGHQRFIGQVTIPDFPELTNLAPFSFKDVKNGTPFDSNILEQQRQFLTRYVHSQGYIYAHVKPDLAEQDGFVDVVWRVLGSLQLLTFGKTVITGNSKLPYEKIIREFSYKGGMPWDQLKIEKTLENLRKLAIFESVSLQPIEIGNPEASKPLILNLVESALLDSRIRIGYQHVNNIRGATYKVGGSLLIKNPTNRADCLRFDGDMTLFYRSIGFQYEVPWILNFPIRTTAKGYIQTYNQPIFMGSPDILYTADHDGFCLNLLRTFNHGDIGVSSGCDWLRIKGLSLELARAINFEPQLINRQIGYVFVEPYILYDLLDDSLNPTWGSLTSVSLRAMVPFNCSGLGYVKGLFEQSFFFPVAERVIGAMRWRFGNIFHGKFSTLLPTERFYLGGPHSLRGYEPNMAPPLGSYGDENATRVPIGGKTMFNINLEARMNLKGNFGGVLFQDIGALIARKVSDISVEDLSAASGFGLRYATPIGPIRFDLGVKWKKRFLNDCRIAWFLTFGHAF